MSEDRARLRSLLGAGTALWAGSGNIRVEQGCWTALSGAPSADYNVCLYHGEAASPEISQKIEEIVAAAVPTVIMLAGAALSDAQTLVDAGWVCVGAVPFMANALSARAVRDEPDAGAARRLTLAELGSARELVEAAFGVAPEIAAGVALPDSAASTPGQSVWGMHDADGTLVSCVAMIDVEDAIVTWSMSTPPAERRHGYGRRLLNAALDDAALRGVRLALHYSSYVGLPFYRALGFEELEHWQLWSRPRWVLGRA